LSPDLITFGETMALLSAGAPGPLRHATHLQLGIAGAESNVAIGVARLGHAAAWTGRVGDDELGLLVLARLRGEGVDVGGATVDGERPTGLMLKAARTAGVTQVIYYRRGSACSSLTLEHLDEDAIRGARVLHLTGITAALGDGPRAAVFHAAEVARAAGTIVCFDPNHRAALWPSAEEATRTLGDLAARADVVLAGEAEARLMAGDLEPAALARALGRDGAAQAVIKRGARGATAWTADGPLSVAAHPVACVDPVGAGDAFAAGYLSALLDDLAPAARLDRATQVAAVAVSAHGDWESLPRRAELEQLLRAEDDVLR
jgi:2-dehydro-3-deoxygluconokinase